MPYNPSLSAQCSVISRRSSTTLNMTLIEQPHYNHSQDEVSSLVTALVLSKLLQHETGRYVFPGSFPDHHCRVRVQVWPLTPGSFESGPTPIEPSFVNGTTGHLSGDKSPKTNGMVVDDDNGTSQKVNVICFVSPFLILPCSPCCTYATPSIEHREAFATYARLMLEVNRLS